MMVHLYVPRFLDVDLCRPYYAESESLHPFPVQTTFRMR